MRAVDPTVGRSHRRRCNTAYFCSSTDAVVIVDDRWIDAPQGSVVLVPGGVTHDFENRRSRRAGVLTFSTAGDFEKNMPVIVQWFTEHPPKDA